MAVTGVFAADFSSFNKAVQESEGHLKGLETAGTQVQSSLRLMTQSQEQLLDKIGASGGKIQELGTTAAATGGQVSTLTASYRQFDGILQAAGINIGPQVKGLEDLANAAGKSTTELGLLGTAGAVAGAALAGWKLGTWIDEVTGASTAIANLTGNLDALAAQTAGAKQDTINLAIKRGADETIKYGDAVKYLTDQVQVNADKSINWREKLADAHREVRNLTDAQKAEIAIAQEAGATTEQLTNKYGLSATGLGVLADQQRAAAAATAEHTRASAALTAQKEAEAAALEKAYNQLMSDTKNANQLAIMNADAAKMEADAYNTKMSAGAGWMRQLDEFVQKNSVATTSGSVLMASNEALIESFQLTGDAAYVAALKMAPGGAADKAADQYVIDAWTKAGEAAQAATDQAAAGAEKAATAQAGYVTQIELTSDGIKGWIELMQFTNASNALLNQNSLFTTKSTLENQARLGGAFSPIPGFASGVENFEGGLARVHGGEVLANLPKGTSVYPRGQGLGATIANTFNLVDTESNLAKRVAEQIMRQVRAGTQLGTT